MKVWSIKDQNLDEDLALVYKKMMNSAGKNRLADLLTRGNFMPAVELGVRKAVFM